jgi:putative membrane protein
VLFASFAILSVALSPEIDSRADRSLPAHMLQHLLVAVVAAPLLAAGAPFRLLLGSLGRSSSIALVRVLRSATVRLITRPVVAAGLFCTTIVVIHFPAMYEAALGSQAVHAVEHAALFWTAVALWAAVFAVDPLPPSGVIERIGAVIASMATMAVVGAALSSTDRVIYRPYLRESSVLAAVSDQHLAGGMMWIGGMIVVLPLLLVSAMSAMVGEERKAVAREQRIGGAEAVDRA